MAHFWPKMPLLAIGGPNGSQKWYKWWYTLEHMLEDYSGRKTRQKSAPSGVETAPKWPIYDQKCLVWPLVAQKSVFCYRTPNFINGPFVTLCETVDLAPLDRFLKFSFPSYGPKWPKMAIFGDSPIASISTPNFGPISMKLGPVVRFTKKMTLNKCGPGSGPNYRETAICPQAG